MNTYAPEGMAYGSENNARFLSSGIDGLERAMNQGVILESRAIMCDGDMNLRVDLRGIKGIIPKDEVCYDPVGGETKDIAIITRVGKPVCFKVVSIDRSGDKPIAYLSRRDAQIECYNNYINDLIPGDVILSKVTKLESFGAFVDVGCGIIALMPVDCISVSRFSHPSERLYCGMVINTLLKTVDEEKGRIFVSLRELLGTWEENAAGFTVGQTVSGIIRSVERYGVFVELTPNLAGLAELKVGLTDNADIVGRRATVFIKSIIPERMKIKLIIIDVYQNDVHDGSFEIFTDCGKTEHISRWRYSPLSCHRIIETVFE